MTIADKIRQKLRTNPNANAVELAAKLGTTPQNVYQIRHSLKKKQEQSDQKAVLERSRHTREQNGKPLSSYIIETLEQNKQQGLKVNDDGIRKAVKRAGYVTHSANFLGVVRAKLYELRNSGIISRDENGMYALAAVAQRPATTIATAIPENDQPVDLSVLKELASLSKKHGGIAALRAQLQMLESLQG